MDGFYAGSYLREGDRKLIRFYARADDGGDELELYDLANDPGERRNLAQASPAEALRLNELLERHLVRTAAVIPRFNPAFVQAKAAAAPGRRTRAITADDLPGGWKNRAGAAAVRDGALAVRAKGADSFLGVAVRLEPGTAKLSFRVRSAEAGAGKIVLLSNSDRSEILSVPYRVDAGAGWQAVTLELPVPAESGVLRLYLPSGVAAVEFDDIVLSSTQGEPRRWSF